eukprot:CAMPEP_0196573778 /NCGR_PEP_ID=MMETSP1081-20130531/3620_1 /TAXON_ID=36882 /ORGANISM="Pyramimonas amylifera, Strain CCMP720" /LENGTH=428 /DNA_ID=CAMNT_0041891605 /DNA_START=21 /DNA_END=1307 /DNA_ORIENTATION=+
MDSKSVLTLFLAFSAQLTITTALYSDGDGVELLTEKNWKTTIEDSEEYWIVEFFAPWCGHCKQLAPEWQKAAKELQGIAHVAAVDCDVEKDLAQKYGIKGFPTIKIFAKGGAGEVSDYNDARISSGIVSYVKKSLGEDDSNPSSRLVYPLRYQDAYSFLYLLEKLDIPKVILFTQEKRAPKWYESLAVKYKQGKVKTVTFSHAGPDEEGSSLLAKRLGVAEAGSLVVCATTEEGVGYFATLKQLQDKGSANLKAAQKLVDSMVDDSVKEDQTAPLPPFPPPDKPRKLADTVFFELNEDTFDPRCFASSKKSICLFAAVKSAGDEFPEKSTLVELSKKYRNDPVAVGWLPGSQQTEFLAGFGVQWEDHPVVIAVKTGKRKRFAVMEGEVSLVKLSDFVDRILGGDLQFSPLKSVPELVPSYLQNIKDEF